MGVQYGLDVSSEMDDHTDICIRTYVYVDMYTYICMVKLLHVHVMHIVQ